VSDTEERLTAGSTSAVGAARTATGDSSKPPQRAKVRATSREMVEQRVFGVLKWVMVAFFLIVTVVPFYYMLLLSFRAIEDVLLNPGSLWVPLNKITISTYKAVFDIGFFTFMRNSFLISLGTVAATLLVSIPGAYAVSRLDFFGRRQIHFLFLAVYLFPAIVLAIPLFVLFTRLGLRGSLFGLILVYVSQTVPVSIHMLRNYFDTVPKSLEEAAATEGATRFQIIRRVSLPLAAPAIMSTGLFVFMIAWNEFLFALLFLLEDRGHWTVSLGLSQLSNGIETPKTILMAGAVILTIPIVALFFATERLLVEGLTAGAEKG
jgi:multiple sugar transport system permease protein